jgi:hypothetical protein
LSTGAKKLPNAFVDLSLDQGSQKTTVAPSASAASDKKSSASKEEDSKISNAPRGPVTGKVDPKKSSIAIVEEEIFLEEDLLGNTVNTRQVQIKDDGVIQDTKRQIEAIFSKSAMGANVYNGYGEMPEPKNEKDIIKLDITIVDPTKYGLTKADVEEMKLNVSANCKLSRISLDVLESWAQKIDTRHVNLIYGVINEKYRTKFSQKATKKALEVIYTDISADVLVAKIKNTFSRTESVSSISIPILVEAPKISEYISVEPATMIEGIVLNVSSSDILRITSAGVAGRPPLLHWIFCHIWNKVKHHPSGHLLMPNVSDILPVFMKISSGININGLAIPCIQSTDLLENKNFPGYHDLVTAHVDGWINYYAESAKGIKKAPFLARFVSEQKNAVRKSTLYAGREIELQNFVKGQHGTSNIYGLSVMSDSNVVGVCLLPPPISRGVAGKWRIAEVVPDNSHEYNVSLPPKLEGYDINSALLNLEVSDDRSTAIVISINQKAVQQVLSEKPDYQFSSVDIINSLSKYGIRHGIDKFGHAVKKAIECLNNKSGSCEGLEIATLDRSEGTTTQLLRNDLDVLVSQDQMVTTGQVLAKHRNARPILDIYGQPLSASPCLSILDGVSYENGVYVATRSGSVIFPRVKERIGVQNSVTLSGVINQKDWDQKFGSKRHLDCSLVVNGDLVDLSGITINGNVTVTGTISGSSMIVNGDLSAPNGGLTLGGRSLIVRGNIECAFIQGYTPDDSAKISSGMTFGTITAKDVQTGFLIGCVCYFDNVTVSRQVGAYHNLYGGSIVNSQVYVTEAVHCDIVGGNFDANNVIITAGVQLKEQRRVVRSIRRADKFKNKKRDLETIIRRLLGKSKRTPKDDLEIQECEMRILKCIHGLNTAIRYARLAEMATKKGINRSAAIFIYKEVKSGASIKIGNSPVFRINEHNKGNFSQSRVTYEGGQMHKKRIIQ